MYCKLLLLLSALTILLETTVADRTMPVYLVCVYCAAVSQWEEGVVTLGCGLHTQQQ
jgi:hypothetical protein